MAEDALTEDTKVSSAIGAKIRMRPVDQNKDSNLNIDDITANGDGFGKSIQAIRNEENEDAKKADALGLANSILGKGKGNLTPADISSLKDLAAINPDISTNSQFQDAVAQQDTQTQQDIWTAVGAGTAQYVVNHPEHQAGPYQETIVGKIIHAEEDPHAPNSGSSNGGDTKPANDGKNHAVAPVLVAGQEVSGIAITSGLRASANKDGKETAAAPANDGHKAEIVAAVAGSAAAPEAGGHEKLVEHVPALAAAPLKLTNEETRQIREKAIAPHVDALRHEVFQKTGGDMAATDSAEFLLRSNVALTPTSLSATTKSAATPNVPPELASIVASPHFDKLIGEIKNWTIAKVDDQHPTEGQLFTFNATAGLPQQQKAQQTAPLPARSGQPGG